jgi:dTDP-4-amino-4,6-dideoxy-D-galactose acyltransferase
MENECLDRRQHDYLCVAMTVDQYAVPLSWDSEFFGFKVAKLVSHRFDTAELGLHLEKQWERGVRVVYWGSDPADAMSQSAALANQGLLVDRKTIFVRKLEGCVVRTSRKYEAQPLPRNEWNDDLASLAMQIGLYSRFRMDPHFPSESWQRLYCVWLKNSINRTIADDVLVVRESGLVVAVVTVRVRGNIGEIGLLGVHESWRRVGLGRALLDSAMCWFSERSLASVRVVTQGDNQSACEMYQACGFFVDSVENFYHFWRPLNDSV